MRTFILKGSEKKKFIDSLITQNKIPAFNIFEYKEPVGIADAKGIKKIAATAAFEGANRLFIISGELTGEAQNAILKLLEELPEDTFFIFAGTAELLPTIVSRCQVVNLAPSKPVENIQTEEWVNTFVKNLSDGKNSTVAVFKFAEKAFSEKDKLDVVIASLRKIMVEQVLGKDKNALYSSKILKAVLKYQQLINSNNLNARLAVERALLEEFNT